MCKRTGAMLIAVLSLASFLCGAEGAERSPQRPVGQIPIALSPANSYPEDVIVYSAHQEWLSRIYVLRMNGSVITYFEYPFYYFADLEVVNNEVYAAEAFAPKVYKVDLSTGGLDLVIDDWSLYYFYDLAFDGTYFYLTEWDLNRYDIGGTKYGTASFDESVFGGAWDGSYYWTLTGENQIKCWDIRGWPAVAEVPQNSLPPPTPNCRGLWFDGEYFWTAESIDGMLGQIYQFSSRGTIINQWLEPAFSGWSACVIKASEYPQIPETPYGPTQGETGVEYHFSSNTSDPEDDSVLFLFDWGDGAYSDWLGPYASGDTCLASNTWSGTGSFPVKVKAKDIRQHESDWSSALDIGIFARGDCNGDGLIDLGDVVFLLNYLFKSGLPPDPIETGDANRDETIDLGDVVYLLNYLFKAGPPPSTNHTR